MYVAKRASPHKRRQATCMLLSVRLLTSAPLSASTVEGNTHMQAVQGARTLSKRPAHGHTGAFHTMGLAQQRPAPFSWSLQTLSPTWSATRPR